MNKLTACVVGIFLTLGSIWELAAQAPAAPKAPNGAIIITNPPVPILSSGIPDIMRMVQAGVEQPVVLAFVQNSPVAYHPSAKEVIYLRAQGVSADVIAAMLKRGGELRDRAAEVERAAPPPPAAPVPAEPVPTAPETPPTAAGYPYDYSAYPYAYPSYVSYGAYSYPYYYGYPSYGYRSCYPYYGYRGCYPYYGYGYRSGYYGGYHCYSPGIHVTSPAVGIHASVAHSAWASRVAPVSHVGVSRGGGGMRSHR